MGTPLFVIDGVQSDEGQFNNIDFNDIESISILKDASASIYGVQGCKRGHCCNNQERKEKHQEHCDVKYLLWLATCITLTGTGRRRNVCRELHTV